jgi:hypothetical protein
VEEKVRRGILAVLAVYFLCSLMTAARGLCIPAQNLGLLASFRCYAEPSTSTRLRAFSGKVDTGFPEENAT